MSISGKAIRVEGLSKRYLVRHPTQRYETMVDSASRFLHAAWKLLSERKRNSREKDEIFWALRDVEFEMDHGDVLGIIGHNGAGKSTLLKILSRITTPTSGEIDIYGRVGCLLEVGTGFHPELTGRENIFLNGIILGMRRLEIKRRFDEIVEFSGVEKFIDTPVKRYSTGMEVRLAFAIAAHLEAEILLVDEVLAVGDAEFQRRCLDRMGRVASAGRTVIFVSHNMAALAAVCGKGLVLNSGNVTFTGSIVDAVETYLRSISMGKGKIEFDDVSGLELRFKSLSLLDHTERPSEVFAVSSPVRIVIEYDLLKPMSRVQMLCHIWTRKRLHVLVTGDADFMPHLLESRLPGRYRAEVIIPADLLAPGQYYVHVAAGIPNSEPIDAKDGPAFEVTGAGSYAERWSMSRHDVVVSVPLKWNLTTTYLHSEGKDNDRGS